MGIFAQIRSRVLPVPALLLPNFVPAAASAGWGDENWGQMVWGAGAPQIPAMTAGGIVAVALVFLAALCGTSSAQTTHTVLLESTTFVPDTLTIDEGDTVDFVWNVGVHNVVSGPGVPDGAFDSGPIVPPPFTFSVTFDSAFLAANPMPGNLYDYYCDVHLGLGMVGTITVTTPVPALPTWGLITMAGTVVGGACFLLRKKRRGLRQA